MSTLRVRVYNVKFGDAVLVSVPDRGTGGAEVMRHILIDFGNVQAGAGGDDSVFAPVMHDVIAEVGDRPLDLYVMTHEHLDHVQGLLHVKTRHNLEFPHGVRYAWLTASAAADYYETHENARKKKLAMVEMLDAIGSYVDGPRLAASPLLGALLANNNPRATGDCVELLRKLAPTTRTSYVYRGIKMSKLKHPFKEAKFEIWAPEEDTSAYYGRLVPLALGASNGGATAAGARSPAEPLPPAGVDAGAFYDLVEARRDGLADNLLTIDRAANNSSIVFCLEWRGWRLLFPGDAEEKSWKIMAREGVLKPVHFLKVAHHGSHNGTPDDPILDRVMPPLPHDGRPRFAAVSTCEGSYNGVPHGDTMRHLGERCTLRSVEHLAAGQLFDDFSFDG